jgi:glucose/arabinose dehydrogenase
MSIQVSLVAALSLLFISSCSNKKINKDPYGGSVNTSNYDVDSLPAPFATKSVQNFSMVVGWKDGKTPVAPKGFTVTKFADGFDHPRWIYVADN